MAEAAPKTHAVRALADLREQILTGKLEVGMRLFEVPIAEQLDVSRTPVRDAFARLAEEGLLERLSGGGYVVRSFSHEDAIDAIELRGVLEGMAVRLAAERGPDPARLAKVKKSLAEMDACFGTDAFDIDRYSAFNEEFHWALAALPGSSIIKREIERAAKLPFASPRAFLPDHPQLQTDVHAYRSAQDQHRAVVAAIEAREGARAEAIAREHARIARQNLEILLNEDSKSVRHMPGLALIKS